MTARRAVTLLRALVAALVTALLLTSCGVPPSGPARTVDSGEVPYGLLEERPPTSSPKRDGRSSDGPAVYFTRRGILVRIGLQSAPAGPQARLAGALDALATGPTAREQEMGIGTAIPAGLRITAPRLVGGQAEIDLSGEAAQPDIAQNALATGQIVLTATSVDGVLSVVLTRDGRPVRPVLPGGNLAPGAVTRADYLVLLAPAASSSTTSSSTTSLS